MEKVLIVIKPQNNRGLGLNAFYEGKIVLGQVKVGDVLKLYTQSFDAVKDITVTGLVINKKIVDDAGKGTELSLRVSRFESDAYLVLNDLNMLHSSCVIEFEDMLDGVNVLNQRFRVSFPDEFHFSCLAQTREKMLGSINKSQVQLDLVNWFYLHLGQKIECKFEGKSICAKIVKILK